MHAPAHTVIRGLLVVLLIFAGPTAAQAAPEGGGVPSARRSWPAHFSLDGHASYASAGEFQGPGAAVQVLWLIGRHGAIGTTLDAAYLHSAGLEGSQPYELSFVSTFLGSVAQARIPIGRSTLYGDLALGYIVTNHTTYTNVQCAYGSGPGVGVALGFESPIGDHLLAGVRATARNPGLPLGCFAVDGPHTFGFDVLAKLGLTVGYRWQ